MQQLLETNVDRYQAEFFKRLNALVVPGLKRGRGSPGRMPAGLLLLDVVGRKSGAAYPTPVFAVALDEDFLVGSVRGQSQWIRNLAAADKVSFWLRGDLHEARLRVFISEGETHLDTSGLPLRTTLLLHVLRAAMDKVGGGFALLETQAASAAS